MDLRDGLQKIRNVLKSSVSKGNLKDIKSKCLKECDNDQCSVCFEKQCNTMLLPCLHEFHADCIIQWTEKQFTCPLCRVEITHFVPKRADAKNRHQDFRKLWEKHYITKDAQKCQTEPETFKVI